MRLLEKNFPKLRKKYTHTDTKTHKISDTHDQKRNSFNVILKTPNIQKKENVLNAAGEKSQIQGMENLLEQQLVP